MNPAVVTIKKEIAAQEERFPFDEDAEGGEKERKRKGTGFGRRFPME